MAKPGPGLSSWSLPSPQHTDICTMTASLYLWFWKPCIPPSVSLGMICPALSPPYSCFPTEGQIHSGIQTNSHCPPVLSPALAFTYSVLISIYADPKPSPQQSSSPTSISLTPLLTTSPFAQPSPANWISSWIPQVRQAPHHSLCSPCDAHVACSLLSSSCCLNSTLLSEHLANQKNIKIPSTS